MLSSAIPAKFPIYWASAADPAFVRDIPENSQIGIQDGAASLQTGFPPVTFDQLAAGGSPPFGQDFNGIMRLMTQVQQWQQAGGGWFYDSVFASSIGGYPKFAILNSDVLPGAQWCSLVDGNTTDPDDPLTSANWMRVGIPSGTPMPFLTSSAMPGFVTANGLTIGNASSNGTGRANDDTLFLYVLNWGAFSNTQCPILTSAGAPSTRGANAVADFIANKQLTLPNMKGLSLIGVDTMGGAASSFLTGVPVTIGGVTLPGSIFGENLHAIIVAELAIHNHGITQNPHSHTVSIPHGMIADGTISVSYLMGANTNGSPVGVTSSGVNADITINNAGSGTAHNTVQRSMGVYWSQKL